MGKLNPSNFDNVRFTKSQYEFLAWSIRQVHWSMSDCEYQCNCDELQTLAEYWAGELRGTNVAFKRDRFISAVVKGTW